MEAAQPAGVLRRLAQVVEVHPGGEHRAVAANHDASDVRIDRRLLEGVAQRRDQLPVEGVALLRSLQEDMADRSAILDPYE